MKSKFLSCLMWNMELFCMQFSRIGPHHAKRGTSHCFRSVAEGTWCIFSSYDGEGSLRLMFFSATSGLLCSCEGYLGILLEAWQGNRDDSRGEP